MAEVKKILVVDDDPRIVRLLSLNLQHAGYQVAHAYDGMEALRALTGPLPDLVILDIGMPHLTGLEALKAIRNQERLRHLPVIMLTAHNTDRDVFTGYHEGANVYLTKPVNPAELLRYVKQVFSDIEQAENPDDVFEL
jgi:two-component system alkaline phosphatase synthesis response regulator PhoP/two-component system response regulator VicR